jgi:hypothetical protein
MQIALGLAKVGSIEMENGKRDADDGDKTGENNGIRNRSFADEELKAALVYLL